MDAIRQTDEKASRPEVDERDVRALTEYLTVLGDVGRARDAEGLYIVVSQSGREYLVDAEQGACECEDFQYRDTECKHVRRVAFATGRRAIPTTAAIELDVDPSLGEHVAGELRYLATDGGEGVESDEDGPDATTEEEVDAADARTDAGGPWFVRDRDRDKVREFESREAAENAVEDLEGLGLDVELVSVEAASGGGPGIAPIAEARGAGVEGSSDEDSGGDDPDGEKSGRKGLGSEESRVPTRIEADAIDLDERSLGEDPLEWLPDAFVDVIDGTPAINRKGFEVLAHFYDVDVETEVQVGPADSDHEYCQVKATATMPSGRRCEALASAHVDRGDDPHLLVELADTRARKRAISIATGVGVVAVEELRRPEHA